MAGISPVVPVVDFDGFIRGNQEERKATAAAVDNAFRNVGFVYLRNHGIPESRISNCFGWSKKFFDLPYATKMKSPHPPGGSHHRGYSGIGQEKVSQKVYDREHIDALREESPDVKESYECGNVHDEMQPNIWPPDDAVPGFRDFMESFFEDCSKLVHNLLDCLSLALGLSDSISPTHARSLFQLRLLHYPSIPTHLLSTGARKRISAHSDFGTLTLLFQDSIGGLEIEDPNQKDTFRSVEPMGGTVIVNIGDLMERWSNGRWKSTVHRVGVPPVKKQSANGHLRNGNSVGKEEVTASRYSVPFFATADPDTVIDALPGTWDEGANPKQYPPVTAWDYVQMRMAALY